MNVWAQGAAVAAATALVDVCWTKYLLAVSKWQALRSANWSAAIVLVGAVVVVSYTANHWFLIPAALGAWVGTFVTVRRESSYD